MTVAVRVVLEGTEAWNRALAVFSAEQRPDVLSRVLKRAGFKIQELATTKYIRRGGQGPPLPRKLTSRTGRLRGSIRPDFSRLPKRVDVGTFVAYGPVHELGGRIRQSVARHTRTRAFGRPTVPYQVGPFQRVATYPKRPYLRPAAEEVRDRFLAVYFADEYERAISRVRR